MDQPAKTFTPEGTDTHNWIGRLIVAVILGEAIWNLIVSVMSNLVVPWLGDVMGQSSGLPTSFTQRPYNYPDLFVSIVELCIAGIVAAILNHFFQRPTARKVKAVKIAPPAPLEPGLSVRQPVEMTQPVTSQTEMIQPVMTQATPSVAPPRVEGKAVPVVAPVPAVAAPAPPVPGDATATISKPVNTASPAPPVADSAAKPSPAVTKPEPVKLESPKPKKPKAVYYNIVGEPVSSDED
jgi:hypothetical protein